MTVTASVVALTPGLTLRMCWIVHVGEVDACYPSQEVGKVSVGKAGYQSVGRRPSMTYSATNEAHRLS